MGERKTDLIGTWRQETHGAQPLDPKHVVEWVLGADGCATLTDCGPGTWDYADGHLTIAIPLQVPADDPARDLQPRYEIVHLSKDRLELRYIPDERLRADVFNPAIRRLAPDAPGVDRRSVRAGLVPWALDYPGGRTATVYLPDDDRGQDAVAELVGIVERSLVAVRGFTRVG